MSTPHRRPDLPGLSSHAWSRLTLGFFLGIPVMAVVTLSSAAISSAIAPGSAGFKNTFFAVCITLFLAVGLIFLVCALLTRSKNKAEVAAGYSTMPFEDKPVDVYDVKTGQLLRSADQPALTSREQLRAARARRDERTVRE